MLPEDHVVSISNRDHGAMLLKEPDIGLNDGLDELRKENTNLENKLALIDLARNTET